MMFLAALRCDRIDAPCVLDQPVNAQSFSDYIEQCLVPTLSPGDVVIMDNLSSHKKPAIRNAIRAVGARLLFLPPYSPDLNPIEQVFAKLKHLMRKAAERSHEATWRRVGTLLDAFSPPPRMPQLPRQLRIWVSLMSSNSSPGIWWIGSTMNRFGFDVPHLGDLFVGCEPAGCLEPAGEVVGSHEVGGVRSQLVVALVVEAFDGRLLDGSDHPLDLTVSPRMVRLGEPVLDAVRVADPSTVCTSAISMWKKPIG